MRGDLVEQQDRGLASPLGDQLGMREDDPEQQRLLLAGRGERRGARLVVVRDDQVDTVRPDQGPPGSGIARATLLPSRWG